MISVVEYNPRKPGQTDVLLLRSNPVPIVRVAFIGLGKRGKEAFRNFMYLDGVEVVAICDHDEKNIQETQEILAVHHIKAHVYEGSNDWRLVCEREDVDLVYVCTDRSLHTAIGVYAMQCGKHVALEVPAARTVAECWQLVDTAEQTRKHCMMLENCCYDKNALTFLSMSQNGLFGEIFHVEGGYLHDLKGLDLKSKSHYQELWKLQGNPYPTHGIGPACQLLNIHRGDKMEWLTSVSSGQFNFPPLTDTMSQQDCLLGNINTTIIKTSKGKTIVLQHDISSPRPYSRNYLLSGTKGFVQNRDEVQIALASNDIQFLSTDEVELLMNKYEHPFYQSMGEKASRISRHGGMNYIMDYRLIYCLQNGLALDMDVYDAAEWSCIVELSSLSVSNDSQPVQIPDFTRGAWNKLNKLPFF